MIKRVFDAKPKGCTASWFAGQLNCRRSNIYDIFNRQSIDTELLARICRILDHDFFKELSDEIRHNI